MGLKNIEVTYAGRRIFDIVKGQLSHCFVHEGKEHHWTSRPRAVSIGHVYKAQLNDKGQVLLEGYPQWIREPDKDIFEWERQDELAAIFKKRFLASRKSKRLSQRIWDGEISVKKAMTGLSYIEAKNLAEDLAELSFKQWKKRK